MKKNIAILLVLVLVLSFAAPAFAGNNALTKLGRGVANVLTSPVALGRGITECEKKDGILAGLTVGALNGTFNVLKRIVVGTYEIVTFPIPLPQGYDPILTDPEYFMSGE
ncbi:MAG: exosortase system-associated protein, TIGR04073 family [Candidatus Omnitrophica bacterium]|nr:exosortase system-associated protein, TIGR04073 family [Candidatus Omnitrophota bacterium]